jgi:flavin-dependent thymidylate synthase
MSAVLMFDNARPYQSLLVPKEMGSPKETQLAGSAWDNLCELAGRVCYDSLGKGRSSVEYHEHIRETSNRSVYEHATFTIGIPPSVPPEIFLNRPSLWVYIDPETRFWRLTLNLRHVLEWSQWGMLNEQYLTDQINQVGHFLAPLAVPHSSSMRDIEPLQVLPPKSPEERWLTFFITGVSRGLSHELVRHGDYTAISQRSTRYCDESQSPWYWHPLLTDGWVNRQNERQFLSTKVQSLLDTAQSKCQEAYQQVVQEMIASGVELKPARGAARGVLGNALGTELIFSASLAQWWRIVGLRNHPKADDEIRIMAEVIERQLPNYSHVQGKLI